MTFSRTQIRKHLSVAKTYEISRCHYLQFDSMHKISSVRSLAEFTALVNRKIKSGFLLE